jgi:hypothetical protein
MPSQMVELIINMATILFSSPMSHSTPTHAHNMGAGPPAPLLCKPHDVVRDRFHPSPLRPLEFVEPADGRVTTTVGCVMFRDAMYHRGAPFGCLGATAWLAVSRSASPVVGVGRARLSPVEA